MTSQFYTLFNSGCSHYLNLNKENMNFFAEYGFLQQKVIGPVDESEKNYDKKKAIILSLNDERIENWTDIIRLLSTLLSLNSQ